MNAQANPKTQTHSESQEAGRFFRYMAEFVGFGEEDKQAIKESQLIIEKHLPGIIAGFYVQLLQYPPTRKFFLKKDGTIDDEYLRLRMFHQSHFWRRAAGGEFDDAFAHFVDHVGRAHTSRGADPRIYIAERYVIAMVGFVQHAITDALHNELREFDPNLEVRATKAWNKLSMVILELLARAYDREHDEETYDEAVSVDSDFLYDMSIDAYEQGLGMLSSWEYKDFAVAKTDEIPDGERKIVQVEGLSIGVFHHKGNWYAVRNHCLHRGGPVAAGKLDDDTLICPWHGFAYNVTNGCLLMDTNVKLETYPVTIMEGEVHLTIPMASLSPYVAAAYEEVTEESLASPTLADNEFLLSKLAPGEITAVEVNGEMVAVYNVDGQYYATQNECTHTAGPLDEGELDGYEIVCPWHASCFDIRDGSVTCGPAKIPLQTYMVILDGEIGRVVENE
jgi:nitrite reductase/ring-hydroxylating ferredoxin subunit